MHRPGVGLGEAALNLYLLVNANQAAIDGRMNMIATSTDTTELFGHLRGLVTLLREQAQPLDYTQLFRDLRHWDDAPRRPSIRRRWAASTWTGTNATPLPRPPLATAPDPLVHPHKEPS
ncbi:type I-E CRISPR-associated protein Cse2/CasB [Nocardiopsis sp. ARC36]